MADKKTFTIEINGIEKAYDNTIKLRDAVKQLENIEINVKDNVSDSLNKIEQNYSQINKAIEVSKNAYQDLNDTIQTNTDTLAENNKESSNNISISESVITSINQRKESLQNLKEEYDNLSEAQRNNSDGQVILEMMREEERAIANATIEMVNFNKETQTSIAINSEEMGSINQKKIVLEQLKDEYNKLSEIQRNSSDGAAIIEMIEEAEVALGLATKTLDSFGESNKRLVEIFKEEEGSIAQKKVLLENLKLEYEALGTAQRNSAEGDELIFVIKATEEEIETLSRRIDNNLQVLSDLGASIDIVNQGFNQASSTIGSFKDILSSGAEVAKALGVENESLNNAIEGLSRVTETLNTLQAFHTSLVNKDSIVMKAAITAKKLYTAAVQGSSASLKGFKIALASTGIGAILVLVGALITNFDDIKKTVSENVSGFDKFQDLLSTLEPVLAGVGNALVQLLLNPVKQIMNAVGGLIDVISIFKEKGTDGFKEAFEVIGNTANNAKDIVIESYDVIGNYNKGVQDKIVSNEKEANKKRMIDDAKLKDDFIKNSEAKNGSNWKFTKEGYEAYQAYFAAQALLYKEDSEEFAELMRKKMSYEREFTESNKSKGPKRDYAQEEKDYKDALQNLKDSTEEYQNQTLEKEIEFNRKMVDTKSKAKISESQKLEIENLKKSLAEKISAQKKAADEEIKGIKDKKEAKEKAAAAEIALQQAKLDAEKQIAQAEIDAINKVLNTRKEAVSELESIHLKEKELLDSKLTDELSAIEKEHKDLEDKYKGHTSRLQQIDIEYQKQKTALEAQHKAIRDALQEKQNEEVAGVQNKVKETEAEAYLQRIDLDEKFLASKQDVTNKLKEDKIERDGLGLIDVKATKENYQEAIKADKEYLEELKKNKDTKLEYLDEQIKASEGDAKQQAVYLGLKADTLKNFEVESAKTQARIKENTEKETGVLASKYDELYNKIKEKWDKINSVMTTVGTVLTSALKGQLEELQKKQEEITKQYDEAVEKHKASQEKLKSLEEEAKTATGGRAMVVQEQIARQMEANNELAKQEKDLAKQKEKLEKDAAKKEKQMKKIELTQGLVTGIANTAMGVLKALAMGPIIGPIMAAMIGAMGAVQTATITKQISKLENGGMLSGKRHSQGGMRIEGTNIEVEGDEYVINRISTRKNLGLINYINKNKKELKAEDINSYFARTGTSQQQIAIPTKQMYEQGGMLTNLEVVDAINSPENDRILEAISQINFKPVVSVVDITSAQNSLSEVKDIAGA